jgi:hypothetical protein
MSFATVKGRDVTGSAGAFWFFYCYKVFLSINATALINARAIAAAIAYGDICAFSGGWGSEVGVGCGDGVGLGLGIGVGLACCRGGKR